MCGIKRKHDHRRPVDKVLKGAEYLLAWLYYQTVSHSNSPCTRTIFDPLDVVAAPVDDSVSSETRMVVALELHLRCIALNSGRIPFLI